MTKTAYKLFGTWFLAHFNRILTIGDTKASTAQERLQNSFIIYIGILMSLGGIIWGVVAFSQGFYVQAIAPLAYPLITTLNFIYLYYSKNLRLVQFIQIFISLALPFVFQIVLGGFVASGAVILWSILTILVSFRFQDKRLTSRWFLLYLFMVLISGLFDSYFARFNPGISMQLSILFFTMNITVISTIIMTLFYYYADSERKLYQKIQKQATTDALTGLENRRSFFKRAESFFVHRARQEDRFIIMMLDIDHFKSINDRYGHECGDRALKAFAAFLKELARDEDYVARYGGEEFIILLKHTTIEGAEAFAQRILQGCRDIDIVCREETVRFTVSIGISQVQADDSDLLDVLKRSDKALYRVKEAGRDHFQTL